MPKWKRMLIAVGLSVVCTFLLLTLFPMEYPKSLWEALAGGTAGAFLTEIAFPSGRSND